MISPSSVAFDPAAHRYTLDGRELISVTQALSEAGLIDSRWFTDEACLRGTYVHQAIALYHAGDLDEDALDPALQPYFDAYRRWEGDASAGILHSEYRVVDAVAGYAGTLDLLATLSDKEALIDIKTGAVPAWVGPQTAAYLRALRPELPPALRVKRCALQLKNDGTYRLDELTDRNDEKVFLAALTVAQWRRANGTTGTGR